MSKRAYSEINLHIVWRVKSNICVLRDELEQQLHRFIRDAIKNEDGVYLQELGGADDHIHLAVTVPPTLLISEWIGRIKGASAHYINHRIANRKVLEWQTGYGVVSFGTSNLSWVVNYIRNQRVHHSSGGTHQRLENVESNNN